MREDIYSETNAEASQSIAAFGFLAGLLNCSSVVLLADPNNIQAEPSCRVVLARVRRDERNPHLRSALKYH